MFCTTFGFTEAVVQKCSVNKVVLKNFAKFTGTNVCHSLFLSKVFIKRIRTLLKGRLWYRCFPVNFAKFLRTSFFMEHLWWLLLVLGGFTKLSFSKKFTHPCQKRNFTNPISRFLENLSSLKKFLLSPLIFKDTKYTTFSLLLGVQSVKGCLTVPVATGMALVLSMLAMKERNRQAKYVIWPRIDQKSCFKSILTAGL